MQATWKVGEVVLIPARPIHHFTALTVFFLGCKVLVINVNFPFTSTVYQHAVRCPSDYKTLDMPVDPGLRIVTPTLS